jgi:hypothetical protein
MIQEEEVEGGDQENAPPLFTVGSNTHSSDSVSRNIRANLSRLR